MSTARNYIYIYIPGESMYGTLADIRVVLRINLANLVSAYSIHGLLGNPMLLIFAAVDYATATRWRIFLAK